MASWGEITIEAPEFAARVRALFDAGTNKTLATLRSDGAPRISGTEVDFTDEALTLGMMPRSMKHRDVLRDPRVAIHSPTLEPPKDDPSAWPGDAKASGTLQPMDAPEGSPFPDAPYFNLDITELVLTYVDGDMLEIESWHPGRGWEKRERS